MRNTFLATPLLLSSLTAAFPWAAKLAAGEQSHVAMDRVMSPLERRAAGTCPVHATRQGAAPYSAYYPSKYTGAMNGQAGTGVGGVQVPAPGDTAHAYVAPGPGDIRGPW